MECIYLEGKRDVGTLVSKECMYILPQLVEVGFHWLAWSTFTGRGKRGGEGVCLLPPEWEK